MKIAEMIEENEEGSRVLYDGKWGKLVDLEGDSWDDMNKAGWYLWEDRSDGSTTKLDFGDLPSLEQSLMNFYDRGLDYIRKEHPVLRKMFAREEKKILSSSTIGWIYYYARDILGDRWPEAEPMLSQNPKYAHKYAVGIIEDRWPEAEPVIAGDPESAYLYAIDVFKDRWPLGEPAIKKDPIWWRGYLNFLRQEGYNISEIEK